MALFAFVYFFVIWLKIDHDAKKDAKNVHPK